MGSNSIQTYTGVIFDFENYTEDDINVDDIAHSLFNQCRWTGHTSTFYSIGLHSLLACERALKLEDGPKIALEALLHDAAEAYVIDLSRPLKRMIEGYTDIQDPLEALIAKKFDLPWPMSEKVAEIDNRLLMTEYYQLIVPSSGVVHPTLLEYGKLFPPYDDLNIFQYTNDYITYIGAYNKSMFLDMFNDLTSSLDMSKYSDEKYNPNTISN